jgi:alkylhydroperoxidase family enzyme
MSDSHVVDVYQLPTVLRDDPADLTSRAPEMFALLHEAWAALEHEFGEATRRFLLVRVSSLLLGDASEAEPRNAEEAALAPLVDQFVDYVPEVGEDEVEPVRTTFGDDRVRTVLEAIYVVDQLVRLGIEHSILFTRAPRPHQSAPSSSPRALGKITALWHERACALRWLDSATAEVNRMRSAFYHDCRMCQSVRVVEDGNVVIPPEVVLSVRDGHTGAFPLRYQFALRLADAHMVDPSALDIDLVASLKGEFSNDELLELTLDMTAWNFQKVAVSVRTEPPYREGELTEMFIQPDGRIKFGGTLGPAPVR